MIMRWTVFMLTNWSTRNMRLHVTGQRGVYKVLWKRLSLCSPYNRVWFCRIPLLIWLTDWFMVTVRQRASTHTHTHTNQTLHLRQLNHIIYFTYNLNLLFSDNNMSKCLQWKRAACKANLRERGQAAEAHTSKQRCFQNTFKTPQQPNIKTIWYLSFWPRAQWRSFSL